MNQLMSVIMSLVALVTSIISQIPGIPVSSQNIRGQLQQCLPKSDQASKETCDRLLSTITSFDDCVSAGFTPLPSNPEQCELPNGKVLTKGTSASTGGQTVSMTGTYVCLPHKNTGGIQTMECAFGMKSTDSKFYALDTSMDRSDAMETIKTQDTIKVEGTLVPIEDISTNQWQKYDIKGIIRVNTIIKVQ